MFSMKKKVAALAVSLCMVSTFTLTACGTGEQVQQVVDEVVESAAKLIEGDVTGEVGTEYTTKWFTFSVDSMTTGLTYEDYTAADGNKLLIAHITETNISGEKQPFGTFDWFVDDDTLIDYLYPLDPLNDKMMPASFELADGETASYDVVIEYPSTLTQPYLMYIEADETGQTYTTFKIPIA